MPVRQIIWIYSKRRWIQSALCRTQLLIDCFKLSDILSDMKKILSVAEFTKTFGRLSAAMAPGEAVQVTAHGKPVGRFIREGGLQRRRNFDIGQRLQQETYSERDGQRLIDSIIESA